MVLLKKKPSYFVSDGETFTTHSIKNGCATDHRDKRQCVCRISTTTCQESRREESVGVFDTTESILDAKSVESADCHEMAMLGGAVRGSSPSG